MNSRKNVLKHFFPENEDGVKLFLEHMKAMGVEEALKQNLRGLDGNGRIPEPQSNDVDWHDEDISFSRRASGADASRRAQFSY